MRSYAPYTATYDTESFGPNVAVKRLRIWVEMAEQVKELAREFPATATLLRGRRHNAVLPHCS